MPASRARRPRAAPREGALEVGHRGVGRPDPAQPHRVGLAVVLPGFGGQRIGEAECARALDHRRIEPAAGIREAGHRHPERRFQVAPGVDHLRAQGVAFAQAQVHVVDRVRADLEAEGVEGAHAVAVHPCGQRRPGRIVAAERRADAGDGGLDLGFGQLPDRCDQGPHQVAARQRRGRPAVVGAGQPELGGADRLATRAGTHRMGHAVPPERYRGIEAADGDVEAGRQADAREDRRRQFEVVEVAVVEGDREQRFRTRPPAVEPGGGLVHRAHVEARGDVFELGPEPVGPHRHAGPVGVRIVVLDDPVVGEDRPAAGVGQRCRQGPIVDACGLDRGRQHGLDRALQLSLDEADHGRRDGPSGRSWSDGTGAGYGLD